MDDLTEDRRTLRIDQVAEVLVGERRQPARVLLHQDARLVEAMRSAGFTWGGLWLVPDPGHYELVPPD